ncbi:hypothetical protein [Paenirhodobacter populi]|uniref:Uncharacterized protein n=1 Tax=Paenirhodobacter populi TaxID=2306993 RepID=A0A443JKV0_9RHOB|nr:hypothetical protein [Sinirhodobacter populi]RWR21123.1 hypothetical protein D2T30_09780 [Sinirhodobacter populi]
MMQAKDRFFDRVEFYYDFRDAKPEDFSPIALKNLAHDLVQACDTVSEITDCVNDPLYRQMISKISDDNIALREWECRGYHLNEGARLLARTLTPKFGFKEAA